MIRSFRDKETEKVYKQEFAKHLPPAIQQRALHKLMLLDAAETENDLMSPPGNRFEHLTGDRKEECSIRINQQWRITFRFERGDAHEVAIEDYH